MFRDARTSQVVKSVLTSSDPNSIGTYSIPLPTNGGPFTVEVPTGRGIMKATPDRSPAIPAQPASFSLLGVPAKITVSGPAGSYVLLSANEYTSANPPPMKAGMTTAYYTGTIGVTKQVSLSAPVPTPTNTYFLTCWLPSTTNGRTTYAKTRSSTTPALSPQQSYSATCSLQ